jgi:GNAT superfamily N-acetyltransferase
MAKKKKPQLPKKRSIEAYAMILRQGAGAGHHGDKAKYTRKQKHKARDNAGLSKREKMMIEAGILPPRPADYVKPGMFGPFVPMVGKFKYKVKMDASEEHLDVALYEGATRVGLIQLSPIGKGRNVASWCQPLVEALRPLKSQWGEIRGWYVSWSEVDEDRRGQGLGRLLYDAALDAMYKAQCGYSFQPGPVLFAPGDCVSPFTTSDLAARVWPSLARDYAHGQTTRQRYKGDSQQNYMIRVDQPPVFRRPKAARRAESAAANPRHARRMRRNPSDLERALAGDKDLYNANLYNASLRGADLTGANLFGAYLSMADLSGANLYRAKLSRTDLSEADLTGANLEGANLYEANLSRADLRGADLRGANLSMADLTGANLTDVDLSEALYVDEAIGIVEITRVVLPVQGRSSAFDKWFGKSKIVNEDGTPKVLYHGTEQAGFTAFSKEKINGLGFFLTDAPELARTYSGSSQLDPFATGHKKGLYRVYVRMAKPYIHDAKGSHWMSLPWEKDGIDFTDTDSIGAWAKAKKYDGVIIRNVVDIGKYGGFTEPANVYIVFDPTNIKSAAYNQGTWDRKDPDIRHNPRTARRNPRPARANRSNWRGATQVQTLLFDKTLFTPSQARRWAQKHNFAVPGIDQGSDASQYHRVRQHDPDLFRKATMRTIEFTDGVKAVIGVPIGAPPKQR